MELLLLKIAAWFVIIVGTVFIIAGIVGMWAERSN